MNIYICLWNWKDYNECINNWKWFTLPEDTEDMCEWIEKLNSEGKEEIFICDSYHDFINENTNIEALIELSNEDESYIMELSSYELPYSMECFNDVMEGYTPEEIANKIFSGYYAATHEYFRFNEVENIETMNDTDYEKYRDKVFSDGAKEYLTSY